MSNYPADRRLYIGSPDAQRLRLQPSTFHVLFAYTRFILERYTQFANESLSCTVAELAAFMKGRKLNPGSRDISFTEAHIMVKVSAGELYALGLITFDQTTETITPTEKLAEEFGPRDSP